MGRLTYRMRSESPKAAYAAVIDKATETKTKRYEYVSGREFTRKSSHFMPNCGHSIFSRSQPFPTRR